MATYFPERTNADFYFNLTDDAFVYSLKIYEFAAKLSNKYNTEEDSIILGHCIFHYHIKIPFLQEGPGFIMTQKMARQICLLCRKVDK